MTYSSEVNGTESVVNVHEEEDYPRLERIATSLSMKDTWGLIPYLKEALNFLKCCQLMGLLVVG